jgi:hypothetical protein
VDELFVNDDGVGWKRTTKAVISSILLGVHRENRVRESPESQSNCNRNGRHGGQEIPIYTGFCLLKPSSLLDQ